MTWQIAPCSPNRYPELIAHIDGIFFAGKADCHFASYGHVYPRPETPDAAELAAHTLLCLDEGRIVGSTATFPMNLLVWQGGKATQLTLGGIGAVSTIPAYRGQGIMGALLTASIDRMAARGGDLSWLTGERYRYQNYGWDLGGKNLRYTIQRGFLARRLRLPSAPSALRPATPDDLPALKAAYAGLRAGIQRDAGAWRRQLARENLRWWVSPMGGYLCADYREPGDIWECCLTVPEDGALLLAYMEQHDLQQITVSYPVAGLHNPTLYRLASDFSTEHCGSIRANAPDALRAKLVALGCHEAPLERLLGYDVFGEGHAEVRPLDWWISRVDHV